MIRGGLDPYQELANAIIVQAAEDYRLALRTLKSNPYNSAASGERTALERFFRSDWYATLTTLNPEMLISRLYKEVFS